MQALVRVFGQRSQPCRRRFAQASCHVDELQVHKDFITPLFMSCSTRSRNIACSYVAREVLYSSCVYICVRAAVTRMQLPRSPPGFMMKVNAPHLTKRVLMLNCLNILDGSGTMELTCVAVLIAISYGGFLRKMEALSLQRHHSTQWLHSSDLACHQIG